MSLRLLQVVLPRTSAVELDEVLGESLGDVPPDRVWRDDISDGLTFVSVLLRADQVEPISDALNGRFSLVPGFRLILFAIEATKPQLEEPEKPKPEKSNQDEPEPAKSLSEIGPKPLIGRISREELYEDIAAGVAHGRLFAAMVVLSTIVAAAGLLRDAPAVIIGAMVIAPLLGPNMALALATTLGDRTLMRRALHANALGAGIALAMSAAMGLLLPVNPEAPELAARTAVGLTDVVLALASGTAGALAFTAGVPATLVGVMVAVALLPPATAAGVYLGAGEWARSADAFSLLAVNVVCVNLSATATFLLQGVRPDTWWEADRARSATHRALLAWAAMLSALVLLLVLT